MSSRYDNTSDVDLVRAVCAGDREAYGALVDRHLKSVYAVAVRIVCDASAAQDVSQDVFVRAYERLHLFDRSRSMKAWLVRIACRLARDRWRRRAAAGRREQIAGQETAARAGQADPLEALIADESGRTLWQAVTGLPASEQAAVILYYREGLSVEEVAEATDVTAGTVKTLLFRARGRLRERLAERNRIA